MNNQMSPSPHSQSQQQQQQTPQNNNNYQQQQTYPRSIASSSPVPSNQPSQVISTQQQQQQQQPLQRGRVQAPPSLYDQHLQRMQKEASAMQQETTHDNYVYSNGGAAVSPASNNSRMEVSVITRATRIPAPRGGTFSTTTTTSTSMQGATSLLTGAPANTATLPGDHGIATVSARDNDHDLPVVVLPSDTVGPNNINNFR
jgi:hypothetical protein